MIGLVIIIFAVNSARYKEEIKPVKSNLNLLPKTCIVRNFKHTVPHPCLSCESNNPLNLLYTKPKYQPHLGHPLSPILGQFACFHFEFSLAPSVHFLCSDWIQWLFKTGFFFPCCLFVNMLVNLSHLPLSEVIKDNVHNERPQDKEHQRLWWNVRFPPCLLRSRIYNLIEK